MLSQCGEEGDGENKEGRTASSVEVGSVHGLSHAKPVIGAGAMIMAGPSKEGVAEADPLTKAMHGGGGDLGTQVDLFGPHSPREGPFGGTLLLPGLQPHDGLWDGTGGNAAMPESEPEEPGDGPEPAIDPLATFLISCSSSPTPALLPMPAGRDRRQEEQAVLPTKRSSGWLAAKPTAGWSTMDKVKMVLLKKSDI